MSVLLLLLLLPPGDEWSSNKPPALLAMEAARAGWSQIECTWSYQSTRDNRRMFYSNRYGEGEWLGTELGDEKGFGSRDADTGELNRMYPTHTLHKSDGKIWLHEENCPFAQVVGEQNPVVSPDLRSVGLTHIPDFIDPWQTYSEHIWKPKTAIQYRQYEASDGKICVEARSDAERTSIRRWILDPDKQFQPDRLEMIASDDGRVKRNVELRYAKSASGDYFLEEALFQQEGQTYAEVKVTQARVHDPGLPK